MNDFWEKTLGNHSKLLDAEKVIEHNCWFCPLEQFGVITVQGNDAADFLNNMLSNNIALLSQSQSQWNVYCNPKGRAYCGLLTFMRDDNYCLRTTQSILEPVFKRFQMYILRAQVQLSCHELYGLGVGGSHCQDALEEYFGPLPETLGEVLHKDAYTIIHTCSSVQSPRYEIYAPPAATTQLSEYLSSSYAFIKSEIWRKLDILSGIPNLYQETSEKFVPQMINFDLLNAISFSKGCYPGQEIVARTHYLGKIKRRMYCFSATAHPVAPDTPIFMSKSNTEQASGQVIDACSDSENNITGLAVLKIKDMEQNTLYLGNEQMSEIKIESLPYAVTLHSHDPEKGIPV